jgi:hypothetical protein
MFGIGGAEMFPVLASRTREVCAVLKFAVSPKERTHGSSGPRSSMAKAVNLSLAFVFLSKK